MYKNFFCKTCIMVHYISLKKKFEKKCFLSLCLSHNFYSHIFEYSCVSYIYFKENILKICSFN